MTRNRRLDAVAGLIASAVALGAAELMAGLTGSSLVVAVGNAVVDYTPGPVVKHAIELLGHHDKPTILWSVVAVALLLGAVLGPAAARRRWIGTAAFAGFGLLGALAAARDPLTGAAIAFLDAAVAAAAGWIALRLLLDAAAARVAEPANEAAEQPGPPPAAGSGPLQTPGRGVAGRRRFLAFALGASGAAAAGALAGRGIGSSTDVAAERQAIVLPTVGPTAANAPGATATPPPPVGLQVPGLSPLVTPNDDFYRIDTALVIPRVSTATWQLSITGMVDHPYSLTFDDLLRMTSVEHPATLVCVSNDVGGDLAGNAQWLGVPLPALLAQAGVQPGATQVVGRSVDGFTVGFPTAVALDGRASMVAIGMNGQPLPVEHGFPARLIVPGLYGYVSATKWLQQIELTTLDAFDAYWIPRGWAKEGPIKTESRVDVPRNGASLRAGKVSVAGVAWGGIRGISRVHVRIVPPGTAPAEDQWREARLGEELAEDSWRQWLVEWDATPGRYLVEVRATDGHGNTQTATEHPPAPSGATGYHMITVKVSA